MKGDDLRAIEAASELATTVASVVSDLEQILEKSGLFRLRKADRNEIRTAIERLKISLAALTWELDNPTGFDATMVQAHAITLKHVLRIFRKGSAAVMLTAALTTGIANAPEAIRVVNRVFSAIDNSVAESEQGSAEPQAAPPSNPSQARDRPQSPEVKSPSVSIDTEHPFGPGSHAPLDDNNEMPVCHTIKGNATSMKYHRPDSEVYGQTKAEVWFSSPAVAEAAGFLLAGSHPAGSSSADFEPGGTGHPCSAAQVAAVVQ